MQNRTNARLAALGVLFLCSALPGRAFSQTQPMMMQPAEQPGRLQLNGFAGWATSSDIYGTYGRLVIGDAASVGADLGITTPYGAKIDLKWIYFDPSVRFEGGSTYGTSSNFHVPTNYFLVGGEKGIRRDRIEPFFGGSLGAVLYLPESFTIRNTRYNPSSTWRMAFGLGGGLKIFLTQKIALRLGIEMVAPIFFSGTSVYVGTGGAGMAVSGGIPTVTGNFTAGVTFAP